MKNMRLIVNLTQAWVHKKFNDNFVEQWMARPGKWNRTVPGSPKSHESTQLVEISVIHPSNDKVKYPQGNLCNYDGIFASCLHYKGMTREAESMMWFAGSCIMQQKLTIFHNMVVKACKGYTLVHFRELNFKQNDTLFEDPSLVILSGKMLVLVIMQSQYTKTCSLMHHMNTFYKDVCKFYWCCQPFRFQNIFQLYTLKQKSDTKKE